MNKKKIIGQINGCNVYEVNDFLELTDLVMREKKENLFIKTSRSNIRMMCILVLDEGEKTNIDEPHGINCESGFKIGWCICSNIGVVPVECQKVVVNGCEFLMLPQNLGCDKNVLFITKK